MKKVFLLLFFLLVLCSFAFAADRSSSWVRPISPSGNITYTNVTNINGTNCSVTGSCHNITYLDYDNAGALRVDTIRLDNGWIYDGAGNQVFEGSNGIAKLGNSFDPTGYTTAFYGNVNGSNKNITNAGTIKANLFDGSMDCSNITSATSNLCTIENTNNYVTSINITGTTTKNITLTREGLSSISALFEDLVNTYFGVAPWIDVTGTNISFNETKLNETIESYNYITNETGNFTQSLWELSDDEIKTVNTSVDKISAGNSNSYIRFDIDGDIRVVLI